MNLFFSPAPYREQTALAVIRIIFGCFLVYHGKEVFDETLMDGYAKWEAFQKWPSPSLVAYLGKATELLTGVLILLGLLTRIACIVIAATFLYIVFFVGHGQFWYEDQHPFMFAVVAAIFFFTGPGRWSIDARIFNR
jgi:putative oxidoreductase